MSSNTVDENMSRSLTSNVNKEVKNLLGSITLPPNLNNMLKTPNEPKRHAFTNPKTSATTPNISMGNT